MTYKQRNLTIDPLECVGCGHCETECLGGAFGVNDDGVAEFDRLDCIICHGCDDLEDFCPAGAIEEATA